MTRSSWPVLPGAEPFDYPGRPEIGVLLVHGFTGSPFEMRPVGQALARAGIGSIGVLLRGHGTHPDDMVERAYAEWIADVEGGLDRLLERHERAVIVGLSMGGTLALNVASRRGDDPRLVGLVTIGAPLYRAIPALLGLMRETSQQLPFVHQPILIVQPREDHIVPPGNANRIHDGVTSTDRQVLLLDNCYHVCTVDFAADLLNCEIVRFVHRLASRHGQS